MIGKSLTIKLFVSAAATHTAPENRHLLSVSAYQVTTQLDRAQAG